MRKLKYQFVKTYIRDKGYKLLSPYYPNARTKMEISCPNEHIFKMNFHHFQKGVRCPECHKEKTLLRHKLKPYEKIKEKNGQPYYTCTYCGVWFLPSRVQIYNRWASIKNTYRDARLYCSDTCKQECPIFYQKKYPRGFKQATSREIQPELRQLVFKRDNYTCKKCNTHQSDLTCGLHCHHILALNDSPIESADVENCVAVCKDCHKAIHTKKGCQYHELRCA